jgi:dTDP-4-dehydrorhamnose 3,5-epimerase
MKVCATPLEGVLLFESKVRKDSRGYFLEVFRDDLAREAGIDLPMVQTNRSFSKANVLRGLHFQNPSPQGKFVSVSHGAVFDVAVDLRPDSPTFLRWFGETLTNENGLHLWIPVGFAHGFVALTDAVVSYQVTAHYNPAGDSAIHWKDPEIDVVWPIAEPILSDKDQIAPTLAQLDPAKLQW